LPPGALAAIFVAIGTRRWSGTRRKGWARTPGYPKKKKTGLYSFALGTVRWCSGHILARELQSCIGPVAPKAWPAPKKKGPVPGARQQPKARGARTGIKIMKNAFQPSCHCGQAFAFWAISIVEGV